MSRKIFNILNDLLEEGRGFDFQSHGVKNGCGFFNFALYPHPDNTDGKSIYKHTYTIEEMEKSIGDILEMDKRINVKPAGIPVPSFPMPRMT